MGKGLCMQSGRKVLFLKLVGENIVACLSHTFAKTGLAYDDPKERRRILKLEQVKRRGRGPPVCMKVLILSS